MIEVPHVLDYSYRIREKFEVQKNFKISSVEMTVKNTPVFILADIEISKLLLKATKGTGAKIPNINNN